MSELPGQPTTIPLLRIVSTEDGGSAFVDDVVHIIQDNELGTVSEKYLTTGAVYRIVDNSIHNTEEKFTCAPHKRIVLFIRGRAELKTSNGDVRIVESGTTIMEEDVAGKGHSLKVLSEGQHLSVFMELRNPGDSSPVVEGKLPEGEPSCSITFPMGVATEDGGSSTLDITMPFVDAEDKSAAYSRKFSVTGVKLRVVRPEHHKKLAGWHPAPERQFIIHLSGGAMHSESTDGHSMTLGPGSVGFVDDTTGKGHISRSLTNDRRSSAFLSTQDRPI